MQIKTGYQNLHSSDINKFENCKSTIILSVEVSASINFFWCLGMFETNK